jgi:hypothetical protein
MEMGVAPAGAATSSGSQLRRVKMGTVEREARTTNGSGEVGRLNGTDMRPRAKSVGFHESNIREGKNKKNMV